MILRKIFLFLLFSSSLMAQKSTTLDWQGHRGCRGLLPENSTPAFLHALDYQAITTLEMDVILSKDGKIVVSHEAWMNHEIASKPSGEAVTEQESTSINLYKMTYAEIEKFDCGRRGHPRFSQQKAMPIAKPTLAAVVDAVQLYCKEKQRPFPQFNIEIKTEGKAGDNIYHPEPAIFAKAVLAEIERLSIREKTCIQSFDVRILQQIKQLDKNITIALLVENLKGLTANLRLLGFKPDIYSCYFKLLTKRSVKKCHNQGIRVIPWTVNSRADMQKLIEMGVDGIITDYPNLIEQ